MEEIRYRKLTENDIPRFIELRQKQLQEEGAEDTFDLSLALKEYCELHLADGTFISWLAVDGERIIGTGGMSFGQKPPYYGNPSGKIGIVSSMYISKEYRRRGLASELLSRAVGEAKEHGCGEVWVTASDMGVLLYTHFGFVNTGKFLQYKIH